MLVSVALPLPVFEPYTYEVPDDLEERVTRGCRVVVPVRGRKELGFVLGPGELGPGIKAKKIIGAPDDAPAIDEYLLTLCEWIADYYAEPLGMVLRTALPVALTGASRPMPAQKTRRVAQVAASLPTLVERDKTFARSKKQREVFELLESLGGSAPVELLLERMSFSPAVLKGLVDRTLVTIVQDVVARDPFAQRKREANPDHAPTMQQKFAVAQLRRGKPGEVFLLHGVTGSGKTLVYLEFLKSLVEEDKGAIVLVPEIALTPQTVSRFRAVFGDRVAVLHSALSDGERYDAWLALKRGEKRIAVGARSAVFAPIRNLGAIIVDEEHEGSYKQGESPRYHAREVAIVRAREQGAVVVLGSATPSLESWVNAKGEGGKYRLLSLPERVGGGKLPPVRVVDMRVPKGYEPPKTQTSETVARRVISEDLEDSIRDRVGKKEQTILLLNRRGYSSFVQCVQCGDVDACPNCSISLTYHRAPERLVCHYCRHTEEPRQTCRQCGGKLLQQRGLGTQQVERILAERIPELRIARMDVDTTSGKWAHAQILDRVASGEVDLLLGTQMIAKGLDFPNVTLVGVVDADIGINLPDFRASERSFQLLSQVAGRAGRGPKGGDVIIQTRVPSHHAVQCAVDHDYERFVTQELASREDPAYPPTLRLANFVFSGTREEATSQLAIDAADRLRAMLGRKAADVEIVGPSKCPVERIKNRWRWHFMAKSKNAAQLTAVCRYIAEKLEVPSAGEMRVVVDRDPVSLL